MEKLIGMKSPARTAAGSPLGIGATFLVALGLAACSCIPGDSSAGQQTAAVLAVADYSCGDRGTVTVKWTAEVAEVTAPEGSWLLPRARSGSGARYADSRREVWEHQGRLRWTDAGATPVTCRRVEAG